ncbi:MAG: hypothetical protein K2J87_03840 [Muribaculaceae bacterium]|nr:hypothetical protein [Muribaculaceae bacterium]
MKKYILPILLSSLLLLPLSVSAESRSNYHRGQNTERSSGGNHRGEGNRPGNNRGGSTRPGHNKHDKKGYDKGHGNNHNNGNHWNGNSNHRPGGGHNPAVKPGKPNHRPGNKPGHHGPSWGHGSSVNAPGHSYRPHHHHPKLGYMVNHAIRGGRYDNVWLVSPGQYAVRFFRNGYYYMQYIWPEMGRYGTPFRIVMSAPGQWYAYDNRNQWYYDDGNSLRISLNGSYLNPWTLVPSIELNINL